MTRTRIADGAIVSIRSLSLTLPFFLLVLVSANIVDQASFTSCELARNFFHFY